MEKMSTQYSTYVRILQRELVCAMGCTEPIAIAYCAAVARAELGALPDRLDIEASGNIIKNVKSVIVPNTDGRRGIEVAAAIGVLGGDASARLEVISHVDQAAKDMLPEYLKKTPVAIHMAQSPFLLDLTVTAFHGDSYAKVRIVNEHTNIVHVEHNGQVTLEKDLLPSVQDTQADLPDYTLLTVQDIYEFAATCDLADVREVIASQIEKNTRIAEEGLHSTYGANIGKVLLKSGADSVRVRAKAYAAAGSDARMNGCELPVVICAGSGNQGLTTSLPVIVYAEELHADEETLYRALVISNLVTLHIKENIGRLSAYCGAVCAGAGAGAGISYLYGGDCDVISHTIVNTLAVTSGIVCDGAKSSCAAKIAMAVEAGILGFEMYRNGQQFYGGEGLVLTGVENSIRNFGRLGREGMRETDCEIIRMMVEQ
ncbi:L-serine ammonia-lyase, iron-sulfur-dependent, subunit alpha [Oscillibacter sp. MSJ-2]|uniref:UPF0597 protein KQI82_03660 n=1 Tax=Dysosmobacter acutus TaxID=2841504 RepID=A0ABS6F8Y3_9FIRM|nr:L-serine ammonia-lyase, iron-sulfur-dependent, subunit alpha [Dysosmobacter acutus]MBU5626032.1 L-serine ammonia-lyase, iron-sulfur-dependent, subunit alpha [Dysosmobacter acutus]